MKYNVYPTYNKSKQMKEKLSNIGEMLKQYSIRLNEHDTKRLQEIAEKKGIPYQVLIRMILREYLNKQDKTQ